MKIQVFIDYLCPFCAKGYNFLKELLPGYPHVEIEWIMCEASPRSEQPFGQHSDVAIQGFVYLKENGGDVEKYHDELYAAVFERSENIEDVNILAKYAEISGADKEEFITALESKKYRESQQQFNEYAYREKSIYAIPVYISEKARLDAKLGVGVTKEDVKNFLEESNMEG